MTTMTQQELFASMSKRRRGVAVAQDVLEILAMPKVCPQQMTYVRLTNDKPVAGETPLEVRFEEAERCDCCALGSLMVGFARLFDQIKVSEDHVDVKTGVKNLRGAFPNATLLLMEIAFEGTARRLDWDTETGTYFGNRVRVSETKVEAAHDWRDKFPDLKRRLKAIMHNVIDNDGEFKPEKTS